MTRNYLCKLRHSFVTYVFFAVIVLFAIVMNMRSSSGGNSFILMRLLIWPIGIEFFFVMLITVSVAWVSIGDFANDTYKNIISSGVSRSKLFFNACLDNCLFVSTGLFVSTVLYFILVISSGGKEGHILSGVECTMVTMGLFITWCRYMMIVLFVVTVSFLTRKLYGAFVSVIGIFAVMFLDTAASKNDSLELLGKIFSFLPIAMAKQSVEAAAACTLDLKDMCIYALPEIIVSIECVTVGVVLFHKADIN